MIKKPLRNGKPIGRDFEFNDPFANSCKKHYWNYGEGNLGFLTTEQLETLRKLKFREVKANYSNHQDYAKAKIVSAKNLNATIIGEPANHSMSQINLGIGQRIPAINSKVEFEMVEPKQSNKRLLKRHKSDLHHHNPHAQQTIQTHKSRLRAYINPAGKQSQLYRKLNSSRKMLFQQGDPKQSNPEDQAHVHKAFHRSSLQQKSQINLRNLSKRKSQMKLQSGILKLKHRQQSSLARSEKSEKQDKFMRIETEPSSQKQRVLIPKDGQSIEPIIKLSDLKLTQESSPLYKSRKFLIPKDHFSKFKRDHSPTFCNSIDYPLSYYRHV